MKILILITQGEAGGAQKHVFDIAARLKKDGYQVTVATGRQAGARDTWLFEKLRAVGFTKEYLQTFSSLQREVGILQMFTDMRALVHIFKFIKRGKFDVVHLHSVKAGVLGALAGKLAGARIIYTVHGFVSEEPLSLLKKYFYIAIELSTSFFVDKYICVSGRDLAVGKRLGIIRGEKGVVIYNGVSADGNSLPRALAREEIARRLEGRVALGTCKVVGTIANLYRTKGIEYLVRAAAQVRDAKRSIGNELESEAVIFVVFGEGELRAELEREIEKYDLKEHFFLLGFVDDAGRYLSGLDLFVLPSVKEGLPYVLLEAARAGVPIIATRVGGVGEIAKQIPMLLVAPAQPKELAKEIQEILADKSGAHRSTFSDIFSLEHMLEQVEQVYTTGGIQQPQK